MWQGPSEIWRGLLWLDLERSGPPSHGEIGQGPCVVCCLEQSRAAERQDGVRFGSSEAGLALSERGTHWSGSVWQDRSEACSGMVGWGPVRLARIRLGRIRCDMVHVWYAGLWRAMIISALVQLVLVWLKHGMSGLAGAGWVVARFATQRRGLLGFKSDVLRSFELRLGTSCHGSSLARSAEVSLEEVGTVKVRLKCDMVSSGASGWGTLGWGLACHGEMRPKSGKVTNGELSSAELWYVRIKAGLVEVGIGRLMQRFAAACLGSCVIWSAKAAYDSLRFALVRFALVKVCRGLVSYVTVQSRPVRYGEL